MMDQLFSYEFFGNDLVSWMKVAVMFSLSIMLSLVIRKTLVVRLKRWSNLTVTTFDDLLVVLIEKYFLSMIVIGSAYFSVVFFIKTTPSDKSKIGMLLMTVMAFYVIRAVSTVAKYAIEKYWERKNRIEGSEERRSIHGISSVVTIAVWIVGILFVLDNLGFKISAGVAGLGIGGVAVALAAQTILGDLFNYFVIFFDRPFKAGDFLLIDNKLGVVEKIGIKTTRIKSLSGEELVFSNTDLTSSRIHNYRLMERRRVEFGFGVVYGTPPDVMERIPLDIRKIIDGIPGTEFDRAHFSRFGESSLDFIIVYYVVGADYNTYMDIQQRINIEIMRALAGLKVEFAFPTRTVIMENNR